MQVTGIKVGKYISTGMHTMEMSGMLFLSLWVDCSMEANTGTFLSGFFYTYKHIFLLNFQALLETALTRVVLPMPILVLPPIIMSILEK